MPKKKNTRATNNKKGQDKLNPLEQIKKLLILSLNERGVQGKRIADVLDVDAAIVSRILNPKKRKQKKESKPKK